MENEVAQNLRVDLLTRSGEMVHSIVVPPFNVNPDVILWGTRVFIADTYNRGGSTFQQGMPTKYYEGWYWSGEASDALHKFASPPAHEPEQEDAEMCSPPGGVKFEDALRQHMMNSGPDGMSVTQEKWDGIMHILDSPYSRRRRRQLIRMERASRGSLGLGMQAAIDWSSIDWKTIGLTILKVLATLLPLILMIF